MYILRFLCVFVPLLWPLGAHAFSYTVCIDIASGYVDIDASEWWEENHPRPARGVNIVVVDRTPHPDTLDAGYADNNGCRTVTVVSGHTYDVLVYSRAQVNGISINSYPEPLTQNSVVVFPGYSPVQNDEDAYVIDYDQVWGALSVASWAMYRSPMNIDPSVPITLYAGENGVPDGESEPRNSGSVTYVDTDSRFTIAHELGHAVGYRRDENATPDMDYFADRDDCHGGIDPDASHDFPEMEYQSAAAVEGMG